MTALALATAIGVTLAGLELLAWGFVSLMRLFGGIAR